MAKQKIKLSKIRANIGQIEGLKKNPRVIKDAKLALLVKSLQETPELLEHRGLLVYPYGDGKYVTIGGNQRLAAAKEAGFAEIWCEVLDEATSVEKLNEYIIKDNASFGDYDFDLLKLDWDIDELTDWGLDLDFGEETAVNEEDYGEDFSLKSGDKEPFQQITFTLADSQAEFIKTQLERAKGLDAFKNICTDGNENSNGNAIYLIVLQWAGQKR